MPIQKEAVLARLPIAAQRQTSDLHCHPSLQDCVRASLPQTCGRPPLHWPPRSETAYADSPPPHNKGKAVTVSSQLFRSLRLLHNCQLTVLVYHPHPLKGRIIAQAPSYHAPPKVLIIR